MKSRIHSDAILFTDCSAAMAGAAQELPLHHEPLNLSAGECGRGQWHIQKVNAYHGRLKSWIARYPGVAT
jgi:hypothetical protein